jgi:hypothetical protein
MEEEIKTPSGKVIVMGTKEAIDWIVKAYKRFVVKEE